MPRCACCTCCAWSEAIRDLLDYTSGEPEAQLLPDSLFVFSSSLRPTVRSGVWNPGITALPGAMRYGGTFRLCCLPSSPISKPYALMMASASLACFKTPEEPTNDVDSLTPSTLYCHWLDKKGSSWHILKQALFPGPVPRMPGISPWSSQRPAGTDHAIHHVRV